MRFRTGMMIGFAAGYVMGSKAGRERYEQLRTVAAKAWGSGPAEKIRETAVVAAGDLGHKTVEAVKSLRTDAPDAEELVRRIDPLVAAASRGDGNF